MEAHVVEGVGRIPVRGDGQVLDLPEGIGNLAQVASLDGGGLALDLVLEPPILHLQLTKISCSNEGP